MIADSNNSQYRNVPRCQDIKDNLELENYPQPQQLHDKADTYVFSYGVEYQINKEKSMGSRWDQFSSPSAEAT